METLQLNFAFEKEKKKRRIINYQIYEVKNIIYDMKLK